MLNKIAPALLKVIPKIEKIPVEKQVKMMWILMMGMLSDMETAKALLENRTPTDNTEFQKELEKNLTRVFLEI